MNPYIELINNLLRFIRSTLPKKLPAAARIFLAGIITGIVIESVCFGLVLAFVELVITMLK